MSNRTEDIDSAREALEEAAKLAKTASDGESKARALTMVADGYRRLWETQQMWGREDAFERRQFRGEPDSEIEVWLGDAFESWLPSARELLLRQADGENVRVQAEQWMVKTPYGIVVE